MFQSFFTELHAAKIPVTIRKYLTLIEGMDKGVADKRTFKNLDGDREIGTRNIKVALRRLRRLAREGAQDELNLVSTIRGTAKQRWLDIKMRPGGCDGKTYSNECVANSQGMSVASKGECKP